MNAHVSRTAPRIAIIGAGIIGLACAWQLIQRGARVTLFDIGSPGRGASWAAAGMLAPAFEAAAAPGTHPRLFDLCMASAARWPAFAAHLSVASGLPVGLDQTPALAVALDTAQAEHLKQVAAALAAARVDHLVLSTTDLRAREPAISEKARGGLELPTDTRVNNRETVAALIAVLRASDSATFVAGPAPIVSTGGKLVLDGHDAILVAAGWNTAAIKVEEHGQRFSLVNWDTALDDIDCHGGQMLSVAASNGAPVRVVRAGDIYLVPRGGEIVIGATVEPGRIIDTPEDAAIDSLRAEALRLCPGLAAAPMIERWTGIRPGTPDHAPFIGETTTPGLFVAAGHYRNGILLAPITAQIIERQILGEDAGELAEAFSTRRAYAVAG